MHRHAGFRLIVLVLASLSLAQGLPVPNGSFEQAAVDGTPAGWVLTGGASAGVALRGRLAPDGDGGQAITVTGGGDHMSYWRSPALPLAPNRLYRLRFRARSDGAHGGTPVTGPIFANRDLGDIPDTWTAYQTFFATPSSLTPEESWLRFGQWFVNGTVLFDDLALVPAQAVHRRVGELELGQGERLNGHAYSFVTPAGDESGNAARPLVGYRASFNTNRWVFGAGADLVYDHQLAGRRWTSATVAANVNYHVGGVLVVEVSADGGPWQPLGRTAAVGLQTYAVPAELLPAGSLRVRLRALDAAELGPNADPGGFQLDSYRFTATVDGPPVTADGATAYVAVPRDDLSDQGVRVTVRELGDALPGADNRLQVAVTRDGAAPDRPELTARLTARVGDGPPVPVDWPAGATETTFTVPYTLTGTGRHELPLTVAQVDGDAQFVGEVAMHVPALYAADYGEVLPGSSPEVGLWWCSSGHKVARPRPLPTAQGPALRVQAARNEAEAAQLVLRPTRPVTGLRVTPTALTGPDGAALPAAAFDVLRVGYVDIVQPTDATGVAAAWPDPLPPLTEPLALEANVNQPLWIRVTVPRGLPAGDYRGTINLTADDWSAEVPLAVEVFDFDLPDRPTCVTAFGFDPGLVYQYHHLTTEADRRAVLELYWQNFSAHRVSPYNPAPLDPLTVEWLNVSPWQGGTRDETNPHDGRASLVLRDESTDGGNVSASYTGRLAVPDGGLTLSVWYRTAEPGGRAMVTLNHYDAGGAWMPGRNNDLTLTGDGTWQQAQLRIDTFPEGAEAFTLGLWAAPWADDGGTQGTTWFDELEVRDAAGQVLLREGFEPLDPDTLRPELHTAAWDAAIERALTTHHFNSFMLPVEGLGGGTFHARVEPSLLGYPADSPVYQTAMRRYLGALQEHLRERGWLDEAFVYWFDEPEPRDYEFVLNGFRTLQDNAPDIGRMLTEQVEPALIGGPNIWCPITPAYDQAAAQARQALGERIWWYICTGPKAPYATLFIDHPATELRVWLWQTWQRQVEGVLVWQTNYWTSPVAYPDAPQNPYEDPMSWVSGYGTPVGTRSPWGNGDGRFLYPPLAAADADPAQPVIAGPVDSIRWELLRDGIEDYEYFVILRRLLADRGDALPAAERARLAALLEVPETVTRSMIEFTTDPAPLEAHRAELARAIARLQQLPAR